MKKYITVSLVSMVASALLVGCGSSNSDSTSSTEDLTGYFIDAPVANCDYVTTSGKKGRTSSKGEFRYIQGDSVLFSLGGLSLGEAVPASNGLITPATMTENEESKVRLLRVLQALDSDNNPSNGITISDDLITALEGLAENRNINEFNSDEEILNLHQNLKNVLDENGDNIIDVSDSVATAHFENSLDSWKENIKAGNGDNNDNHNNNSNGNGSGSSNGSQDGNGGSGHGHGDGEGFDVGALPKSDLNQAVVDSIAYMGNEERLAYDVYTNLNSAHSNSINQFTNITKSEKRHVGIVQDLVRKYDIDITKVQDVQNPVRDKNVDFDDMPMGKYDIQKIQELYDALYAKGVESKQAALEVGCMVEVVDVTDLDKYISQAQSAGADDVVAAFQKLRSGSYNHYWAFDRTLKEIGVSEGCGVLGSDYVKNYPQNEKGHNH